MCGATGGNKNAAHLCLRNVPRAKRERSIQGSGNRHLAYRTLARHAAWGGISCDRAGTAIVPRKWLSQAAGNAPVMGARGAEVRKLLVFCKNISYTIEVLFNPHKRRTPPCLQHESVPNSRNGGYPMVSCNYCTYCTTGLSNPNPPNGLFERSFSIPGGAR